MRHKAWCSIEEMPYCFSRSPILTQIGCFRTVFGFTNGYEMMHKAWSRFGEVPYCFSRSSVKFQGHTATKKSSMATKWCTKLGVGLERCPIVFQGHLWNFKVTRLKKSCRFWPKLGVSGLYLNLPMATKWCTKLGEVPYCFSRSSVKFQGHTAKKKSSILT